MRGNAPAKLLYGAAYYHEYMPCERLAEDVRLMKQAGINFVRIGESTWSSWEPREGVFETEYMDRVLDAMHEAGIHVIVGTPTYAIPPWMAKKHPDILVSTFGGQIGYGGRQNMDIVHPVFRHYAERIIRFVIQHVRDHPAVIGYQIDNETKAYGTAGEPARRLFLERLKMKFGTPEALNAAWGLTYWSQKISSWDEFVVSKDWTNPSTLLEWKRFQQELVCDFLTWQAGIVRELRCDGQFVTHNFDFRWLGRSAGPSPDVNHFAVAPCLDVAGSDIYHEVQDQFDGAAIAFYGDWTRSLLGGKNYFVLETNAQSKGISLDLTPPYDGQLRQAAHAHVARGASLVSYWHWHSCHSGNETYWRGVLGHDLEPNRIYAEVQHTAGEMAKLSPHLQGLRFENQIAIVHSQDSYGALLDRPFSPVTTYADLTLSIHRAFFRRSLGVDFLTLQSDRLFQYALLVVPALYIATDLELAKLRSYVEQGGHLVLTFKSGYCNEHTAVRPVRMPGVLRDVCGFSYQEYSHCGRVPIQHSWPDVNLEESYGGEFVEFLMGEGAEILASYDHPFFGRYPAVTRHSFGRGCVTYLGTVLSPALLEAVLSDSARKSGVFQFPDGWHHPLHWQEGRNSVGNSIYHAFNFSGQVHTVTLPLAAAARDLLGKGLFVPGQSVDIEPWGLLILEESHP